MAVLTTADAKAYLRIEHAVEDALIASLIAAGTAAVEAWMGRPIELREQEIEVDTCTQFGVQRYQSTIFLPAYPINDVLAMEDSDGVAVDLASLRINKATGTIRRVDKAPFANPPYLITAEVGLEALPEYADAVLPVVRQAVLDVVADLYQRRNPAAMSEREGGGIGVQYSDQVRGVGADVAREDLITPRTAALLAPWRLLGLPG